MCFAEIELVPVTSTYTTAIKLLVDDAEVQELKPIKKSQSLRWKSLSLPWLEGCINPRYLTSTNYFLSCSDVNPDSKVTFQITESRFGVQRNVKMASYLVSEIANNDTISIRRNAPTRASRHQLTNDVYCRVRCRVIYREGDIP
jgi:hypothetical protein